MARIVAGLVCLCVSAVTASAQGWMPVEAPHLRVFVERSTEQGLESLTIYENGVALWRGETQFRVGDAEIERILDAFDEAAFEEMPDLYGSGKKWLEWRVSFRDGGLRKEVVQLVGGEHSKTLASLADRIFSIAQPSSRDGVCAADLTEGLKKVASGELAGEALSLLIHFKPAGSSGAEGFLFRLDEGAVTTRPYSQGSYRDAVLFERAPVREVAGILLKGGLASLPANLFAPEYTEVAVKVLKWKKSVLARPFAGMSATTHGEEQKRFDGLFEALRSLHREALAKGRRFTPAQDKGDMEP